MPVPSSYLPSRSDLLQVREAPGAHRVGLRAAVSVTVPVLLVLAVGHPQFAPYATFGAFTSLYGRTSQHLYRVQMQASAAVSLTLAVLTGVLVGSLDHPEWVTVLVAALIAATGDVIARANSYHPPGPLFMVFAFGTIAAIPQHVDDLWVAALVCGGSALFSMLVGVAGVALRPGQLRTVWQEAERLRASVTGSWKPLGLALSVVLAGSTAIALGIGHPYWAMIAAVAPMTAPHVTMQVTRGIQRTMGTTVGLVLAWILLAPHLSPWWTVVVVALLQFITELVVGRNYALACIFITPMALLMGTLGHRTDIGTLLFDRGVETLVGSAVAIALVLVGHHLRERHKDRVLDALDGLARSRFDRSGHKTHPGG